MLNTKDKQKEKTGDNGMIFRFNLTSTLSNMKVGEEMTFQRSMLTTANARVAACRVGKLLQRKFSVRTGPLDEYCTITRTK